MMAMIEMAAAGWRCQTIDIVVVAVVSVVVIGGDSYPLGVEREEEYSAPPAIVVGEERTQPRMHGLGGVGHGDAFAAGRWPRMHPPSRGIAPRPS
jgi:hypothetical protein